VEFVICDDINANNPTTHYHKLFPNII